MRKVLLVLFFLIFSCSVYAANHTFKIKSFSYDFGANPNSYNNRIIFDTDTVFSCEGGSSSKVFFFLDINVRQWYEEVDGVSRLVSINKYFQYGLDTADQTIPYMVKAFRSAAYTGSTVSAHVSVYDEVSDACSIEYSVDYENNSAPMPFTFTPSDVNGPHDTSKVYLDYHKYRHPLFWFYADTEKELTCSDGIVTNRIIPSVNGNRINGLSGDKRYLLKDYSSMSIFLGLIEGTLNYTVGSYNSEFDACWIENLSVTASESAGGPDCIEDPASCNLFVLSELEDSYELGYQDGFSHGLEDGKDLGKLSCVDDPASCGLFDQQDVNGAYDDGYSDGKADGLLEGVVQGEQNCKDNPAHCGLFSSNDLEREKLDAIDQVATDIGESLNKGQIKKFCKALSGQYTFSICQDTGYEKHKAMRKKIQEFKERLNKKLYNAWYRHYDS